MFQKDFFHFYLYNRRKKMLHEFRLDEYVSCDLKRQTGRL